MYLLVSTHMYVAYYACGYVCMMDRTCSAFMLFLFSSNFLTLTSVHNM